MILSSLVLLFIIAPLAGLVIHTSPNQFLETVGDREVTASLWLTLSIAFVTTLIFALAAVPFSWVLARYNFRGKGLVQGLIDLPVVIPHSAAGIAMLGFISREGLLGQAAAKAGISLVGNPAGIALAMAFVSLSFLINSARDGFQAVPERLENAALNLGASPLKMFFTVSLPLSWRSIATGFVMMFARGMSEFGAIVIIAYYPMTAPVLIYERFNQFGLNYARPASLLFIMVALVVFVILRAIPAIGNSRSVMSRNETDGDAQA